MELRWTQNKINLHKPGGEKRKIELEPIVAQTKSWETHSHDSTKPKFGKNHHSPPYIILYAYILFYT